MAYNSTFPILNSTSNSQNKRDSFQCLVPPKYPSYLKHTLYGKLVSEQYKLQTDSLDLRLPTCWNPKDKSKNIDVGTNGLDLIYIGQGKQDTHAALARTNFPMRSQCGIFYFEMRVISKGNDGYIGIGFCSETNKLERLPGWDPESWGYHGDDGHSFAGSGSGKTFGPCFTTGDVIGCGVNFADHSAFYTKNGKFLGTAFSNISLNKPVYPAIGLRTPGEKVTTNFGYEPFVFDILQYITDQKSIYLKDITWEITEDLKQPLDQLVLSYLIHHGYTGTAKAVINNAAHISNQQLDLLSNIDVSKINENDMEERKLIRSAIIHGQIDKAITLINTYFPGVLQEEDRGQDLQLKLKCGKFVEMMKSFCKQQEEKTSTNPKDYANCIDSNNRPGSSRPRRLSYADIAAKPSPSTSTETITDKMNIDNTSASQPTSNNVSTSLQHNENDYLFSMDQVMKYGQSLQDEYRHDAREKTRSMLVEIFSLLAYQDPYSSPVSYLLQGSRRDALATEVNAAILAFQQRPEVPALERMYRQTILCNEQLALDGHGKATIIQIEDYCKDIIKHQ